MSEATLESSVQRPIFAQPTPPPEWLLDEKGRIKKTMNHLDTSKGQVHLLLPSGIGDCAWPWSKYWKLDEDLKAQGRELIWHFPRDNTRRIDPYARLVGMNVGAYIEMDDFRSYPGEFEPEDFETGGVFYVHANVHIENGNPLHENCPKYDAEKNNRTWHPWLPFKNPAPPLTIVQEGEHPPQNMNGSPVWKYADPSQRKPYICVHVGSHNYGDGNWFPRKWGKMIEMIEQVAPVCLIGFSPTGEMPFIEKVTASYTPHMPAVIDKPFATAMSKIVNASAFIGIDDGLAILAAYYGLPVLQAYPDWLERMPGTYEDCDTLHPHRKTCLMPELYDELPGWLEGLKVV